MLPFSYTIPKKENYFKYHFVIILANLTFCVTIFFLIIFEPAKDISEANSKYVKN